MPSHPVFLQALADEIEENGVEFPEYEWQDVSPEAIGLIKQLLCVDSRFAICFSLPFTFH